MELIEFIALLKTFEHKGLRRVLKKLSYEVSKPVAEIVVNLLKGNLDNVDLHALKRYKKLLRDIYTARKRSKKVARLIVDQGDGLEKILKIIKDPLLRKIDNDLR